MNGTTRNSVIVARREYSWRVRSRTFVLSTLLLVALGVAGAAAPIIITIFVTDTPQAVGLYDGPLHVTGSPVTFDLAAILTGNANPDPAHPKVVFVPVSDLDAARQQVVNGHYDGVLAVGWDAAQQQVTWTYYATGSPFDQTQARVQQAVNATSTQVRMLVAYGVTPEQLEQAAAPPTVTITPADPTKAPGTAPDPAGFGLGFGMTVLIFVAIMIYGQWIAMSVAEEKSSRVMEIVLNAASPFQLLAGKVVGVGAVGLTQYACVAVPAIAVLALRPFLESLLLGQSTSSGAAVDVAAGLTVQLVLVFGAFFLLGFALYAVLYAGIASLVSRQEDLNPLIGPLTMVATLGYLLAAWTMSGLIVMPPALLDLLSYVPFLSPYMMLARYAAGQVGEAQVVVALLILAVSVLVALWFAARLYSAGVLLYGQRPSLRRLLTVVRTGG
ncbi:MAG: ABC transporter permease [Candidatus Limnocylindrales bacterium]